MLTREADYAVRIVLHLATCQIKGDPASAAKMAAALEVPYAFLRRILRRLGSQGLLISRRGRKGGVALAKPSETISLLDVLKAIEQHKLCLNACIATPGKCAREPMCPVYRSLSKTQLVLDRTFAGISFNALARHHLRLCKTRGGCKVAARKTPPVAVATA
jgi:Rrf2 family transcriptional regulator, iron-sulfur cluster assembly transcription factor